MSKHNQSRLLSVLLVIGAACAALFTFSGAPSAQVGGRPFGPIIPPTKIGGGSGGSGGSGDVTDVIAGTSISVASPGGPQPIVTLNAPTLACAAGEFASAWTSTLTGTCTAEVGDISNVSVTSPISGGGASGSVSIGLTACSNAGESWEWNGAAFACSPDDDTMYTFGAGGTLSGTTLNVGAVTNGGIVVNADDIGLRADCGSGAVLKRHATNADQWVCATDDVGGGGGGPGAGTPGVLPKWDGAGTALADSVVSEGGGAVTATGADLRSTTALHAPELRWGSATNGTTGKFAVSGGVASYFDFKEGNVYFRAIDGAFISPLILQSSGTLIGQYSVALNSTSGTTTIYGATTVDDTLQVNLAFSGLTSGVFGTTLGVGTDLTVGGTGAVTGAFSHNGNGTYGNATTDSHTVNGGLSASVGTQQLVVSTGTTGSRTAIVARYNGTGALGLHEYGPDNAGVTYDFDFDGTNWTARDTSVAAAFKASDRLSFIKVSGTSSGSNITASITSALATPMAYFDLITGDFLTNNSVTLGNASADTAVINATTTFAGSTVTTLVEGDLQVNRRPIKAGTVPTETCTDTTVQGGAYSFNVVFGASATISTCALTFVTACATKPTCTVSNYDSKIVYYVVPSTSGVTVNRQSGAANFATSEAGVDCDCHP